MENIWAFIEVEYGFCLLQWQMSGKSTDSGKIYTIELDKSE